MQTAFLEDVQAEIVKEDARLTKKLEREQRRDANVQMQWRNYQYWKRTILLHSPGLEEAMEDWDYPTMSAKFHEVIQDMWRIVSEREPDADPNVMTRQELIEKWTAIPTDAGYG